MKMPERESRSSLDVIRTHVVQVSNVSPSASREQLHQMLSYVGRIEEMKLYPLESNPICATALTRLCYVRFEDTSSVVTAQHLTNTPLIDRAIICVPVPEDRIPDEETALQIGGPALPGQRVLPPHVINQIQMIGGQQMMVTIDPTLASAGLPAYPPLPANIDAVKLEEIRRTVYVGNVPKDESADELLNFFNEKIGEVMYMRFAGPDDLPSRFLYVEFANQVAVPIALHKNGIEFKGSKLKIQHSTVAIVKPRAKTADMAKREVEEAAKNAEAAGPLLSKALGADPDEAVRRYSARNSLDNAVSRAATASLTRSRSPSWNRDDQRSRGRSSRSRSPNRGARYRRRSRSRSKRRSKSPRRRSRSRSSQHSWSRRRPERPTRSPSPPRWRSSRDMGRGRGGSGRRLSPSRDLKRDRERGERRRRSPSPAASSARKRSRDRGERDHGREKDDRRKESSSTKRETIKEERERVGETSKSSATEPKGSAPKKEASEEPKPSRTSVHSPMDVHMEEADDNNYKRPPDDIMKRESAGPSPSHDISRPTFREDPQTSPRMDTSVKKEDPQLESQPSAHAAASDDLGIGKEEKHSKSSRRKEKRKKEKKEKKKKRDRAGKKKKSKPHHESSASEGDGGSSSSTAE